MIRWRGAMLLAATLGGAAAPTGIEAQAGGAGPAVRSIGACSLLSSEEIKALLGERTPPFFDMLPPSEERLGGGGSECFISTIIIQLDAVPVARFNATMETYASRTTFERLTGVGDEAYFYEQDPGGVSHVVGIYSRIGEHVLVVSMDVNDGDTPASLQPSLMTLVRAAEPKLRTP
jgi:hypothetical protein